MDKARLQAVIEEMTQNLFTVTSETQIRRLEKAISYYLLQLSKAN